MISQGSTAVRLSLRNGRQSRSSNSVMARFVEIPIKSSSARQTPRCQRGLPSRFMSTFMDTIVPPTIISPSSSRETTPMSPHLVSTFRDKNKVREGTQPIARQLPISSQQVNMTFLQDRTDKLPLVITPKSDTSLSFLQSWMKDNSAFIDEQLRKYGAILVRGFDLDTASDLEKALKCIQDSSLNDVYRGTSPRIRIDGTKYIFSAAEVPVHFPIALHLEMSFLPAPPKRLYFGCLKPSSSTGGETAFADFRKVYQDLDPKLRQKFLEKGIRYERTHKKKGTYFTYDVSDMLGWPQLFGTDDKAKVEEMCAMEGTPVEWKDDETFVSTTHSNAFQLHPETNEPVWFNHTQVFHWTTFPAELWYAYKRCREPRLLVQCMMVSAFSFVKYGIMGHKMSLNATFGDGEPISVKEMHQIREAIHKNMVFSRWQRGDVLILDNFSTAHGRQPTYDKGRKIVVAWADPQLKSNALTLEKVNGMNRTGQQNSLSVPSEPAASTGPSEVAA